MTSNDLEIELKYRLYHVDPLPLFEGLCGTPQARLLQENHYFRTPAAPDLMVRLRRVASLDASGHESGVEWVLTLKGKTLSNQGGLFVRREEEDVLDVPDATLATDEQRANALAAHPLTAGYAAQMRSLGSLRNHRTVFPWEGLALELDQTHFSYSPRPQWELEVETQSPQVDEPRIITLLTDMKIRFQPQTQGKFSRFMDGLA